MSVQNDIHVHLAKLADDTIGTTVNVTARTIADSMSVPVEQVNKTLFNLSVHDKVALIRGENGRSIIGYTLLAMPGRAKPTQRARRLLDRERQVEPVRVEPGAQVSRRRSILTPHLDGYAEAKHRFQRLSAEMGDLVTASFNENPYAEEGLAVLGRLRSIEDQYVELSRRSGEMERDLRALRQQLEEKVLIKAGAAGVLVKQGD